MQTQLQIRQNAMEVQEYMHELFSWEKDLKKKDGTVQAKRNSGRAAAPSSVSRTQPSNVQSSSPVTSNAAGAAAGRIAGDMPSVRGRASSHISAAPVELQRPALDPKNSSFQHNRFLNSSTSQQGALSNGAGSSAAAPGAAQKQSKPKKASVPTVNAAAHTHNNFSKWDKFDVDAALETSSDESEGDETEPASFVSLSTTNGKHSSPPAKVTPTPTPMHSSVSPPHANGSSPTAPTPTAASPIHMDPSAAAAVHSLLNTQSPAQQDQAATQPLLRAISTTTTALTPPSPPISPTPAPSITHANPTASTSKQPSPSPPTPAAPAIPPPIRNSDPTTSDGWRTRGNDLFKAGHYDSAVQCYTHAADLNPTSISTAIPLANRAMAHLKLGRHADAETDASAALTLDPCHVKALQRRAVARQVLGKLWEAVLDLEEVVRLEPTSKAAASERDTMLASFCLAEGLQPSPVASRTGLHVQQAQDPQVSARSAIGDSARKGVTFAAPPAQSSSSPAVMESSVFSTASGAAAADPKPTGAVTGQSCVAAEPSGSEAAQDHTQQQQHPSHPPPLTPCSPTPSTPPHAATPTFSPAAPSTTSAASIHPQQQQQQQQSCPPSSTSPAPAPASPPKPTSLPAPRTSVEFEAAWRRLGGDAAQQAEYLGLLQPSDLPGLFKSSLTAPIVIALLHVFLRAGANNAADADGAGNPDADGAERGLRAVERAVGMLEGLSKVPRFGMTVMSVPGREKGALKELWDGLAKMVECAAPTLVTTLGQLRSMYRLC